MALSEGDEGLLTCIAEVSSMLNPPDASRDSKGISVAEGQRIAVGFPNAKVYITHHIQEVISTLEPGRKARLLDTILKSSVIEYLDDGKLYLLRAIILSAKSKFRFPFSVCWVDHSVRGRSARASAINVKVFHIFVQESLAV